ncbi:MAG: c-type cytochrome [Prevotella sp.]|nr:c-type cytochrome [Prevotella sp.]
MNNRIFAYIMMGGLASCLASCHDDNEPVETSKLEAEYIGTRVGNFDASEWYPGGELGTTNNVGSGCYEDETEAVNNQGLLTQFNLGEAMFERNFTIGTAPFMGLGPAYLRSSCLDCHPGYGHGKRQMNYKATYSNGYLLAIYHPNADNSDNPDGTESNCGAYISEVTGMPQTMATAPFLPPIDDEQIKIEWKTVTAMQSGLPMQFPDGEKYELIYPEVTIPTTAFNTKPQPSNIAVRLESTIGVIGTGLIDAIPQDSIIAQYENEAAHAKLNPAFWNAETKTMADGAWYKFSVPGHSASGKAIDKLLKRYTYALTRASLQDGPGANAVWNITNVSRSDRHFLYSTLAWADAMAENSSVISSIKSNPSSPYYADGTETGIADAVKNLLSPNTDQMNNKWHNFEQEMSDNNFYAFMVWHRGLAIPRARNLNDKDVQRGKELFAQMRCTACHRPKWTTGDDDYWVSDNIKGRPLPKYPHQTIYPYSDFIQHRLFMVNDIHGSWCRTTPLWGRGLSLTNTGAEDRLHDCRARNEVEAIMWHAYSKNSDAYFSASQFYNLSKKDRDAVVKFLRSI